MNDSGKKGKCGTEIRAAEQRIAYHAIDPLSGLAVLRGALRPTLKNLLLRSDPGMNIFADEHIPCDIEHVSESLK